MSLIEYSRRHNRRNHTEELACMLQRSTGRTVSGPNALRYMYDIMSYYNPSIPRSLNPYNFDIPVRDRRVSSRNVGISRPYFRYGHVRFSQIEQPVEQEPIVNEPTLHLALQLPLRPRDRRYGFMEDNDILEDRERFVQRITPVADLLAQILARMYVSLTRPSNEPILSSAFLDAHHRSVQSISGQRHSDYSLINIYGQTFRRLVYGPKIKNFILRHFKPRSENTELIKMQHEEMECKICYSYKKSVFVKCKQCSDGEYHRSCITDWVNHRDPYHHNPNSIATCFICRNRF